MKFVDHKKRGWKSRNAYQNLWLGAQTSSYLYTWSYHTIILMILVCCISTYICRFLPDSPARCQGTLAIGWEALACSSHGGFSSLDVPFQYSLTLLKHVLRSLYIFDDYYIIIYIHQLFIARYVYIYISICIILTSSWWKGHWLASWWLFRLPRLDALLHSRIVWHLPLLSSRPCGPARGPGCLWWFQHVSTIDFPNHQRLSGWTQSSHSDPKCVSSLNYLVGGIPTPLKNMSSSVGTIIPNIWKNNKCSKPATSYDLLSTEF